MADDDRVYSCDDDGCKRNSGSWVCATVVGTDADGEPKICGQINAASRTICDRCGSAQD